MVLCQLVSRRPLVLRILSYLLSLLLFINGTTVYTIRGWGKLTGGKRTRANYGPVQILQSYRLDNHQVSVVYVLPKTTLKLDYTFLCNKCKK